MRKVERSEILPHSEYEKVRDELRLEIMHIKRDRRVHLGHNLTLLFENHKTVRYQIQEMLRADKNLNEIALERELTSFNELIGNKGELGCTLLVEIDEGHHHGLLLSEWIDVPQKIYLKTKKGTKVPAQFDPSRVSERNISGLHHLLFKIGDDSPQTVGCDHPGAHLEVELQASQIRALLADLRGEN